VLQSWSQKKYSTRSYVKISIILLVHRKQKEECAKTGETVKDEAMAEKIKKLCEKKKK